jgi:hypothetical protein
MKTSCNPPREDNEIPGQTFSPRDDLAARVVCLLGQTTPPPISDTAPTAVRI